MSEAPDEVLGEVIDYAHPAPDTPPKDPIPQEVPQQQEVPVSEAEQYSEGGIVEVTGQGQVPLQPEASDTFGNQYDEQGALITGNYKVDHVSPPIQARLVDENIELKEQLLETFVKIAEHPTKGKYWADRFIDNIQNEAFDFGEGGKYEGLKVTDLLDPLEKIYPDIQEVNGKTNGKVRKVSPTAERLKTYLKDKSNREESPWTYGAKDAINATGNTFKEVFRDAPEKLGINLIKTVAAVGEWGIGDIPKAYWMMDGLSEKEAEKKKKELFDMSGHFYDRGRPETVLGQLALSGGEAGLAYAVGKGIYNSVAVPLKTIMPKLAEMLATPGGTFAISEVIGGTLITSREERLAPLLQMLGVTGTASIAGVNVGSWVDYIAGSEDDGVFETRFKSFLDANYTGVGLSLVAPLVMLTGKGAWHASKGSAKAGKEALSAASSFGHRIFQNYPVEEAMRMDLGGGKVVKTKELQRIRSIYEESLLKLNTEEGLTAPLKTIAEKATKLTGTQLRFSEKRNVLRMLEDNGYKIKEDEIIPIINHKSVNAFLQPKLNMDEIFDSTIKGTSQGLDEIEQTMFNLNFINGENVKEAIDEASKKFQKDWVKRAKTHGETFEDSSKILADLEFMIGKENIPSYFSEVSKMTDLLPGQLLAVKRLVIEQSLPFHKSSEAVAEAAEQVANGELKRIPRSLLAQNYIDGIKFMDILESDVRFKGNIARALNVLKKRLGEDDSMLQGIIEGAKDGNLQGEELIVSIAQTVSKMTDTTQLLHAAKPKGILYHSFEGVKSWGVSGLLSGVKTLAAAPLGISMYMAVKSGETWVAAGMNSAGKILYKKAGIGILGTGKGVSVDQAKAYNFGMMQALLEVFGGTGHYQRSAFGSGIKAGRKLDVGDHEMSKMFQANKETLNLSVLGEFTLAKGVTGDALDAMFNLKEYGLDGKGTEFFKFLVNSAGFIQGINGRIIMAEDGFFRTLIERGEMHMLSMRRAEERLRGKTTNVPLPNGDKYTESELMEEYFHVVKNYPKELAEKGKNEALIAVMQERKRGGPVSLLEDFKGNISNNPSIVKNLGSNLARTYAASKFSFIRTMANIYKQSLTERGIAKLAKTYFNEEEARRFIDDEVFRQMSLAQIGSGLLLTAMGVGLGAHLIKFENKEIFMDGVDGAERGNRTVRLTEGGSYGPLIKVRDLETQVVTSYSLERMDMGKAPLVLAAIGATYYQQGMEAFNKMQGNRASEGRRELEELNIKLARALTEFATDLPMAQGAQDFLKNMIPGFGPMWDPSKEATTFFHGFFNPKNSIGSSLRASTKNAREGVKFSKKTTQSTEMISEGPEQLYTNKYGEDEFVDAPLKGVKIDFITKILNQMHEISERVSIVDMRNKDNPVLGQDSYALVSPEGNYIRHLPDPTKTKFAQALATLVLPVVGNVQATENTIEIMNALEYEYGEIEDWSTGTNYNLSPEQRYTWAVYAGRANKETFNSDYWKNTLFEIKQGFMDPNTEEGRIYKADVLEELKIDIKENRANALDDMLYLERNYDALIYIEDAEDRAKAQNPQDNL